MADNYLERRMEDLRNGRLSNSSPARQTVGGRGMMQFRFPPKRVLILGEINDLSAIVGMYTNAGSKVALFVRRGNENNPTQIFPKNLRHYSLETYETDNLKRAFDDLLKAWRDIDILIIGNVSHVDGLNSEKDSVRFSPAIMELLNLWSYHRAKYPYVSDYRSRIIMLGDYELSNVKKATGELNVSVNRLLISTKLNSLPIIGMLSLPDTSYIDDITLNFAEES